MQVIVVKEANGKRSLMVISQGHPPLPPLARLRVPLDQVQATCKLLVGQVVRARSQAVLGGTTVLGHNGTGTFTTGRSKGGS